MMKRREFVVQLGSGIVALSLGACASKKWLTKNSRKNSTPDPDLDLALARFGPVDRGLGDVAPAVFSGDFPQRAHEVVREKKAFLSAQARKGKLPAPHEETEIVVVGGGMSGLLSAYFLRDRKPILLEQAPRLGGHARAESWRGIDYSLGTAYFVPPKPGSPVDQLLRDLKIQHKIKVHQEQDPVVISGQVYEEPWTRGTVPESREQFRKLKHHFEAIAEEREGRVYPEIPAYQPEMRKRVEDLDRISFETYVRNFLGEPIHPHVQSVIENYFWTSSAASSSEVSAAVGLNFLAGDLQTSAVMPGGNAAIAEAVCDSVLKEVGTDRVRPSHLVFDVRVADRGVLISYVNSENQVRCLRAKTVILACPKFVVARLIEDLEPERKAAIQSLKYRSYLVANVLLEKPSPGGFYDLYFMDRPESLELPKKATDIVDAAFANPSSENGVLTVYRAFPYDGARSELLKDGAYEKYHREFHQQIFQEILPVLKIPTTAVKDLRLTRWGHPIPVSQVGNISSGKVDWLRKPFRERIYFAEQDNWTLPCFESAFNEARFWTTELRQRHCRSS